MAETSITVPTKSKKNKAKTGPSREEVASENFIGSIANLNSHHFFAIDFEAAWTLPGGSCAPCEIGIVEFSVIEGEINRLHTVIDPGKIPSGALNTANYTSQKIHGINKQWYLEEHRDYHALWETISSFIKDDVCFAKAPNMEVECLKWLAKAAGKATRQIVVRDISFLVEKVQYREDSNQSISQLAMNKFFKDTVSQFGQNGKCADHKLLNVPFHCALQDARFCMVFARDCALKFGAIDDIREPQWNDEVPSKPGASGIASTTSEWDQPSGPQYHFEENDSFYIVPFENLQSLETIQ